VPNGNDKSDQIVAIRGAGMGESKVLEENDESTKI
jgi:hypothetical protein